MTTPQPWCQRGVGLLEALLALLILSISCLLATKLQTALRASTDASRDLSTAVRRAQQSIEQLRASPAFPDADAPAQADASSPYSVHTQVTLDHPAPLRSASVTVTWLDAARASQQVQLHTQINPLSPVYSSVLTLAPQGWSIPTAASAMTDTEPADTEPTNDSDLGIPADARRTDDDSIMWKPEGPGVWGYQFDPSTGLITQQCRVAATTTTQDLNPREHGPCIKLRASLLQGYVRFAPQTAAPPLAKDVSTRFDVKLTLDPVGLIHPSCHSFTLKTVQYVASSGKRTHAVALEAEPEDYGLPSWSDTGERYGSYTCLIPRRQGARGWSGHLQLVPQGWTLGLNEHSHRVCRYSTDLDGSGQIDRNEEHPEHYRQVRHSLRQQNYLVIRGDLPCPHSSPSPHNMAASHTVLHQP